MFLGCCWTFNLAGLGFTFASHLPNSVSRLDSWWLYDEQTELSGIEEDMRIGLMGAHVSFVCGIDSASVGSSAIVPP
jgi:hypothetical protein